MTDVIDEQRNQLLRKLVGAIVVRAVRHNRRHAVGVVISPHEMVAAGLRGTVGRVGVILRGLQEEILAIGSMVFRARSRGGERTFHALRVCQFQGAIHLIRRDMIETLALISLRQTLPIQLGSLQQRERAHHIRLGKRERILDTPIHMTFSRQVDDAVNLLILHQLVERIEVADVHLHKLIVRFVLHILQVGEVARISQLVQIDDFVLGILVHEKANHVAANEARTASDDNVSLEFHNVKHYSFYICGCKVTEKRMKSQIYLYFSECQ